jgi:hypothetical protein
VGDGVGDLGEGQYLIVSACRKALHMKTRLVLTIGA